MMFDLIDARARIGPDRPALRFDDREASYGELDRRARQLARLLRTLGVRRGDRVGILAANHPAHFDLLLAAPKLGFIYTPLNGRLTPEELRVPVAHAALSLLLADAAHAATAAALGVPMLSLTGYEARLATAEATALSPEYGGLREDDIHMILFTGGSTGTPKGVCLPYRQTWGNAVDTVSAWRLGEDDCAIQCTPCFHAAANVLSLPLLHAGGRVLLMPHFEPRGYLQLAHTWRVSLMFMVPTMFQALAADPLFDAVKFERVRWAISGGAPCPPNLRELYARRGIALRQGFGMTEAGVNCFVLDADEARRHPQSVGRPLPNLRAQVRRADGKTALAGEVGELCLSGAQVCAGYLWEDDADAAAQTFRDGWLHTGDLASCDADGLYTIRGRLKEMYISGGENVYPAEVEAALVQCAGVAECAVLGWPHPRWGECGIAFVVAAEGAAPDAGRLRTELRTRLAGYKLPAEFVFVATLPKNGVGKVLKTELRANFQAAQAVAGRGLRPGDIAAGAAA